MCTFQSVFQSLCGLAFWEHDGIPCAQELAWKRVMSALRAITLRSGAASPAAVWDITWQNKQQTTEMSRSPVKSQYFTAKRDVYI